MSRTSSCSHALLLLALAVAAPANAQETDSGFRDGAQVWVANIHDGTVSVVDPLRGAVVKTIKVGATPISVAGASNMGSAYVTTHTAGKVVVVDRERLEVTGSIDVGGMPYWATASPDGSRVFVTLTGGSELKVIDTATDTVCGSVAVGQAPVAASAAPGGLLLVANSGSNDVSVVDMRRPSLLASIAVGERPVWVEPSADGRLAFAACSGSGDVSVIDLARREVVSTLPVGGAPTGVALLPGGREVLVIDHTGGDLSVFDVATRKRLRTLRAGEKPIAATTCANGLVLVANSGSKTLTLLDPSDGAVRTNWTVGNGPRGLLVLGDDAPDPYRWLARLPADAAPLVPDQPTSRPTRTAKEEKGTLRLTGTLDYEGARTGSVRVVLHRHEPPAGPPVGYRTFEVDRFPFDFEMDVPRAGTYYVRASLDVDPSDGMYPKPTLDPQNAPAKTPACEVTNDGGERVRVQLVDPAD